MRLKCPRMARPTSNWITSSGGTENSGAGKAAASRGASSARRATTTSMSWVRRGSPYTMAATAPVTMYSSPRRLNGPMKSPRRSGAGIQKDLAHPLLHLGVGHPGVLRADPQRLQLPRHLAQLGGQLQLAPRSHCQDG